MEELQVAFEPYADQTQKDIIVNGVDYHNIAATGHAAYYPVGFYLRDARAEVLGGLLGEIWGGWLQIKHLWIAAPARRHGHGTRLLERAESFARARGCVGATVETHSFQARPFYERLGYAVFGTLDGYPPGHVKFFLRKELG